MILAIRGRGLCIPMQATGEGHRTFCHCRCLQRADKSTLNCTWRSSASLSLFSLSIIFSLVLVFISSLTFLKQRLSRVHCHCHVVAKRSCWQFLKSLMGFQSKYLNCKNESLDCMRSLCWLYPWLSLFGSAIFWLFFWFYIDYLVNLCFCNYPQH